MNTNKHPVVNFDGLNWEIISVQGDEWNTFQPVFIDEDNKIRYNHEDFIFPMFEYKITSRKMNAMKSWIYNLPRKTEQVIEVRGKMFCYNDDETLNTEGFGCIFYLKREF